MIRPEGAGSGRVTTRGELGRPGWSRRQAAVAGLVVAALVAAATVAIVLSAGSDSGGGPSSIPAPPTASTPARQAAQTPPYGFTANWADYCYRALAAPPHYAVDPVAVSEPCRAGWTRLSTAQQIGLSARAGATVDRLAVSWGKVEPTPPLQKAGSRVHRFNWASVATVYRAMLSAGMRPIVLVYGTPPWARQLGWDRPGTCRAAHNEGCSYPPSPRHLVDWRTFIGALVRRFPRIVALEVWNEPNVPRFWAPLPSPTLYSRLLQAADKAAHGSGVPVPVVTGGLASQQTGAHGGIPAATFLTRVYRLVGLASFDGIGVHPYPQGPPWTERMTADLDVLRRVRDRFHDHATPLWITEVGVGGTSGFRYRGSVGLAGQGPVLVRMYHAIQNTDVRAFMIYALREVTTQGPKYEPYGVTRANLRPKPAYCYVAQHLGRARACPSRD